VTDDAALFEKCNLPVTIVPGEETNLKITTPVDLAIAEFILRTRL
jgi:2-C-methyl-D-erythritol 4-phosphate cytidylyltransferase